MNANRSTDWGWVGIESIGGMKLRMVRDKKREHDLRAVSFSAISCQGKAGNREGEM
jgi:hypothetical protein